MSEMNLDLYTCMNIAIIVVYAIFFIRGIKKGFLLQVISLLGSVLSFVFAWRYAPLGMQYYSLFPKDWNPFADTIFADSAYTWLNRIAWFLVLFIIFKILFLILEKLTEGLQKIPVLKEVSGLLGGVLGLLSATIWVLIACVILRQPFVPNGNAIVSETYLNPISEKTTELFSFLKEPLTDTEKFNELIDQVQNGDDSDITAIEEILDQLGIQTEAERNS